MTGWRRLSVLANAEGSARASAVIRIGLACLFWTKWADKMRLFMDVGLDHLWLAVAFWVASSCMLLGLYSRVSSAATGVVGLTLFYWLGFVGGESEWIHHHTYLMCVAAVLLALACPGGSLSVDRWRAVRLARREEREVPREWGAQLGLTLIALQVSAVYFWGGLNKLNMGWLSGEVFEWIAAVWYFGSDYPDWPGYHGVMIALTVATVVTELILAVGLWIPRLHRYLLPVGLLLHGSMYVLLPVSIFSCLMFVLFLAFVPAQRFHDAMDRLMAGG